MTRRKLIAAAFILLPTLAVASQSSKLQNHPAFVRLSLAGGNLTNEESYVKYDAKARYYLIATGDCDGASVDLILTPSPASSGMGDDDREYAKDKNIKRVALPRLRNGKGVNIGDTPQQVQKKLGIAPHHSWVRNDLKAREWNYYANIVMNSRKARGMQNYRATYTFRNGRLWSIAYNAQEPDGCD